VASFVLPFERPVAELLENIRELRAAHEGEEPVPGLAELEEKMRSAAREIFADLTPMQKVQLSRHAARPYTHDYLRRLVPDWVELKGDRRFADDAAIVAGLGDVRTGAASPWWGTRKAAAPKRT
jgi:acetyl-CoA carboxylase carboxyl transferase subunit alpha